MGAPVLIPVPEKMVDPIEIAIMEFEKDAIPITVVRRMPGEEEEEEEVTGTVVAS